MSYYVPPHAKYTGYYGYIVPYNDGSDINLLQGDGTLHNAVKDPNIIQTSACGKPKVYYTMDYKMPPGGRRWCPSDHPVPPSAFESGLTARYTPSNY
jgi:hypothetical protein